MTKIPRSFDWHKAAGKKVQDRGARISAYGPPKHLGEIRIELSHLADQAEEAIEAITNKIDRDRTIYIIELEPDVDLNEFKDLYKKARSQNALKLPQDNDCLNHLLYVGSSCATKSRKRTLKARLKQHLVKANKGTYALSLSQWAGELTPGGLVVNAWQFPTKENLDCPEQTDKAARETVLAVEDWLSATLNPMLGKRGSRH